MGDIIRPKNWASFQHYKDRSPPWIKLHKSLLDNYEFQMLPVGARALAPMLWLLASESEDGSFDRDTEKLSFRVRMPSAEISAALEALLAADFFEAAHAEQTSTKSKAERLRELSGFGSRHISDQTKLDVWERDGGKCQSCDATENIEYDHIVPVSKGGNSEVENIQLLCRSCNRSKRVKTAEQFATQRLRSRSLETETETETESQVEKETEVEGEPAAKAAPAKPNGSFALEAQKPKDPVKPRRKTALPANFPGQAEMLYASAHWHSAGRDDLCGQKTAEREAEKFRDHHLKENKASADWDASWRTWVRNAVEFNRRPPRARDEPRKIIKISEASK